MLPTQPAAHICSIATAASNKQLLPGKTETLYLQLQILNNTDQSKITSYDHVLRSWDRVVSTQQIGCRLKTEESWFNFQQRQEIFLFSKASTPTLWSVQPAIQCVPGASSPQVEWLESEADHSLLVPRLE